MAVNPTISRRRLPTLPDGDQTPLPAAVTAATGFLLKDVLMLFRRSMERTLSAHAIRPPQYLMLLVLRDEGPMSQHALGQRVGLDRTTGMQLVQALADRQLIHREDDPNDRRVYRLSLTEDGNRLAERLERDIADGERRVLAPLSAEQQAAFTASLRTLLSSTHPVE
jgi:MarR family transcriptional regulator, lower aerobic nicotinate degradation pathway regulator